LRAQKNIARKDLQFAPLATAVSFSNRLLFTTALPFVIPSEATDPRFRGPFLENGSHALKKLRIRGV
jgi:hypothetical protein